MRNYRKDWQLFFWRTKDGEEIDFVLKTAEGSVHAFEAKLSIQRMPQITNYPAAFQKHFSLKTPLVIVTFGGQELQLSSECLVLPIAHLHDYLHRL